MGFFYVYGDINTGWSRENDTYICESFFVCWPEKPLQLPCRQNIYSLTMYANIGNILNFISTWIYLRNNIISLYVHVYVLRDNRFVLLFDVYTISLIRDWDQVLGLNIFLVYWLLIAWQCSLTMYIASFFFLIFNMGFTFI